jgi:lipoate-protein ligase A
MRLLDLSYPSAEENLAFEEWCFQHFEEETLRIWVNPPSVISGKHQNVLAECNLQACKTLNIPVLRRISGGGTVFHDFGNVNFSFFRFVNRNKMIDYDRSLNLIQKVLIALGFQVTMSERHDLFLGEDKISGNAQHLRSGRVLHHGTILYDANLDHLRSAIKRNNGIFIDKGVKSVRSPITNLRYHNDLGSTKDFKAKLISALLGEGLTAAEFTPPTISEINELISSKYATDEWNFGYSPAYEFSNESGALRCEIKVARGGEILKIELTENGKRFADVKHLLLGKKHFRNEVISALADAKIGEEKLDSFLEVLF